MGNSTFEPPDHLAKTPTEGAAGGKEEEEEKQKPMEIYGVRPLTVGLVERGANRRTFFLAKREGDSMAGQDDQELDDVLSKMEKAAQGLDEDDELDPADGDPMADADPKKKDKKPLFQSFVDEFKKAVGIVEKRNARDPLQAAQNALGEVTGHPELQAVQKLLMDYIAANGNPNSEPKPQPKPPTPEPRTEAGTNTPGLNSLAEKAALAKDVNMDPVANTPGSGTEQAPGAVAPDAGAAGAQSGVIDAVTAAITAALAPFKAELEQLKQSQVDLAKKLGEEKDKEEEKEMSLIAKSMGVKPQTLVQLKKSMDPSEFAGMLQQTQRAQRALQQSGLFNEIGTGGGGGEELMDNEVQLSKAADKIVAEKRIPYSDALIQASIELGLGLNDAPAYQGVQ